MKSKDVSILWGYLNQRKKESKWRDIKLRKAVNYGINRKELWRYAAKGNAYNLKGFLIPPGCYGHNPNLTPFTYDTTKAKALLTDAGYPEGFEVNMIAQEAWKLEAQIISKMLERIGLKVTLDVLTYPESLRKFYVPLLDKPPEEQDWDILIARTSDVYAGGTHFLTAGCIEEADFRWIQYDPVYEQMWEDYKKIVDSGAQEDKVREMMQHVHDHAYFLFVYSPLSLFAVNKEVNFVPQKFTYMRLKETSVTDKHWSVRGQDQ